MSKKHQIERRAGVEEKIILKSFILEVLLENKVLCMEEKKSVRDKYLRRKVPNNPCTP